MNRSKIALCGIVIAAFASAAIAQEKKIQRADLPPAVEKVVVEMSQGSEIRGFNEEKEHGKTFFEAELTVNGHHKDVLMDPQGAVVEVEEQVEMSVLSPAVREGLQAKAGKGTIKTVESLTKKGKLVAYEAVVVADGKNREVQVAPDGKAMTHEE